MPRSLRKQLFENVKCHIGGGCQKSAKKVSRIIWMDPNNKITKKQVQDYYKSKRFRSLKLSVLQILLILITFLFDQEKVLVDHAPFDITFTPFILYLLCFYVLLFIKKSKLPRDFLLLNWKFLADWPCFYMFSTNNKSVAVIITISYYASLLLFFLGKYSIRNSLSFKSN